MLRLSRRDCQNNNSAEVYRAFAPANVSLGYESVGITNDRTKAVSPGSDRARDELACGAGSRFTAARL
jgi:hypothetical protein